MSAAGCMLDLSKCPRAAPTAGDVTNRVRVDMAKSTCSIENCAESVVARSWCRSHYNRWHASGSPVGERPSGVCPECGGVTPEAGATGPRPKYCSAACKAKVSNRAGLKRQREARKNARRSGKFRCVDCGVILAGREHRYCATHSAERASALRDALRDRPGTECSGSGCVRPVRARGLCSMHYARAVAAEKGWPKQEWDGRRRENHYRRKKRMDISAEGSVSLVDVVARDGGDCALCGGTVDMSLSWPHPFSRSMDHVVPLSLGGAHSFENVQLAHLRCNISKGARLLA